MGVNPGLWGVETVAQELTREVLRAAPASLASVALWDRPSFALMLKAVSSPRPLPEVAPVGRRYMLVRTPSHRAALERQEPVLLEGEAPLAGRGNNGDSGRSGTAFRSVYLVPIRVGDTVLGILELGEMRAPERDAFTPEKQERIRAIVDDFVNASAYAWEAERLRRQVRSMSSLFRLVQDMRSAQSFDAVLATSVTELAEWLGTAVRGVLYGTRGNGALALLACSGFAGDISDEDVGRQLLLALARANGDLQSAVSVALVADDPLDPFQTLLPSGETWTRVAVPLMRERELTGLACYYVADDLRPTEWELEALRRRGEVVALGVELVRALIERRRERDWTGRILHEVLTTYRNALLEQMLTGIERLAFACGTDLEAGRSVEHGAGGVGAPLESREWAPRELPLLLSALRAPTEEREGRAPSVDVNRLVELALDVTRLAWGSAADRPGVSLQFEFERGPEPLLAAVSPAMVAALLHVIQNAVEAMPSGGQVRVRTERDNGHVVISVIDTGVGIAEEHRTAAFEPLFSTKGPAHLGLGLSVARALAERHGGEMVLGTEVAGVGARCVLRLPQPPSRGTQAPEE